MSDDDYEYAKFYDEAAKDCRCCPSCSNVVCAGVLAGGLCDQLCFCGDDSDDQEY